MNTITYTCSVSTCKRQYTAYDSFKSHMKRSHSNHWQVRQEERTPERKFECPIPGCGKTFTTKRWMQEHASKCTIVSMPVEEPHKETKEEKLPAAPLHLLIKFWLVSRVLKETWTSTIPSILALRDIPPIDHSRAHLDLGLNLAPTPTQTLTQPSLLQHSLKEAIQIQSKSSTVQALQAPFEPKFPSGYTPLPIKEIYHTVPAEEPVPMELALAKLSVIRPLPIAPLLPQQRFSMPLTTFRRPFGPYTESRAMLKGRKRPALAKHCFVKTTLAKLHSNVPLSELEKSVFKAEDDDIQLPSGLPRLQMSNKRIQKLLSKEQFARFKTRADMQTIPKIERDTNLPLTDREALQLYRDKTMKEKQYKEEKWLKPFRMQQGENNFKELMEELKETEAKQVCESSSEEFDDLDDSDYETRAKIVRVPPTPMITLDKEQVKDVLFVLRRCKVIRAQLRTQIHPIFKDFVQVVLNQLKQRRKTTLNAVFAGSIYKPTKLDLGAYMDKDMLNSYVPKELRFTAKPISVKRAVRAKRSWIVQADFVRWANATLSHASLLVELSAYAIKHGAVGERLLRESWLEANSGDGAYCWVNREYKWKEFLEADYTKLEHCLKQMAILDTADSYAVVPLNNIPCEQRESILKHLHNAVYGPCSVLYDEAFISVLMRRFNSEVIVLSFADGSYDIIELKHSAVATNKIDQQEVQNDQYTSSVPVDACISNLDSLYKQNTLQLYYKSSTLTAKELKALPETVCLTYSQITFAEIKKLLDRMRNITEDPFLNLTPESVFYDIGHGTGHVPYLASLYAGCHAKGIEFEHDKHSASVMVPEWYRKQFGSDAGTDAFDRVSLVEGDVTKLHTFDATHFYCYNPTWDYKLNNHVAFTIINTNWRLLAWCVPPEACLDNKRPNVIEQVLMDAFFIDRIHLKNNSGTGHTFYIYGRKCNPKRYQDIDTEIMPPEKFEQYKRDQEAYWNQSYKQQKEAKKAQKKHKCNPTQSLGCGDGTQREKEKKQH